MNTQYTLYTTLPGFYPKLLHVEFASLVAECRLLISSGGNSYQIIDCNTDCSPAVHWPADNAATIRETRPFINKVFFDLYT